MVVGVKVDGSQVPRISYLPAAKQYRLVNAAGRADATAKVRAGEGEMVKANGKAPKAKPKTAPAKPKAKRTRAAKAAK